MPYRLNTAFKQISFFNQLIGNDQSNLHTSLKQQLAMVKEEFEELCAGVHAHDMTEIRDGIADVLVTVYGLAFRAGIDADADLQQVQESNMSKFVSGSIDDAFKAASEVVDDTGLAVDFNETAPGLWAITSAKDQTGRDGKLYPAGKLLKPRTYFKPEFK